jgi:hypothetical protein
MLEDEPAPVAVDAPSRAHESRAVTRFALALALLPFAVAAVVLIFVVRNSYLPMSDHALTEMHVRDIGYHSVLTGLYSRDDWSHPAVSWAVAVYRDDAQSSTG